MCSPLRLLQAGALSWGGLPQQAPPSGQILAQPSPSVPCLWAPWSSSALWEFWLLRWIVGYHQRKHQPVGIYPVGSGSAYLRKGVPHCFLPGPFSPERPKDPISARSRVGVLVIPALDRSRTEAGGRQMAFPIMLRLLVLSHFLKGSPVCLPGILSLRFTKLAVECLSKGVWEERSCLVPVLPARSEGWLSRIRQCLPLVSAEVKTGWD